ncbi:hypothetical protein GALMADRAFT_236970 [Galerina marginata CBS 339.88]|uniref:Protein YOP1 n=1 Tax=Galerina marginata (strain CBS 339.88) TaxID=685588 RepID=A0A067TWC2_GALM3|nr:hypothetical protein GALMADRAFT_236970 [Galerina marginata CBS 339.88]
MPLFVPILRLLMLFLNVYDSYKTLKDPPTSSRNGGRPSVRAVSQRKRDMKGCLAVWIVWASLSMYERILENIIRLFVPFYDEFKSLGLLFLILTRARGAEPIYLHLIRPLIKPHTRTLDASLELMLMIGDFIFALSTYPVRLGLEWYRQRFGTYYESSESEQETQSESSNDVNTSELPTSFLASSGAAQAILDGNIDDHPPQLPNELSKEKISVESPSRRSSGDVPRNISRKKKPEKADNPNLHPNILDSKRTQEPLPGRPGLPSRKSSRKHSQPETSKISGIPDNLEPNFFKSPTRREDEGTSSHHQIWYPPKSSYVVEDADGEGDLTLRPKPTDQVLLTYEQQQYEEWRQYPAFPSAYPPTPLVTTSRLATTSAVVHSSLYPAIDEEEKPQQDFRKSLLPPREPLNPSHAGDLSDKYELFGITSSPEMGDADDSMSSDDYEEDEFNITLRTPLPRFGSLRSQIQPRRLVSIPSTSSAASIPSRSSALTTADNGSSMQRSTSSDSSLSAPKPNTSSPSVIGKKRSYPRPRTPAAKYRVRQIESEASQDVSGSERELEQISATLKDNPLMPSSSSLGPPQLVVDDSAVSSANNSSVEEKDRVSREEKRRKIVRSIPPQRPVNTRPVRPRVARRASPPTQALNVKVQDTSGVPTKRSSARLRPGLSAEKVKESDDPSSVSASSSASGGDTPALPASLKPNKRNMTRKRS